jgi:glycosyltransferase involved in cell wall biosynthesis
MVTELKGAILAQLEMSRSIEATISLVEHGDPHHADVLTTSSWQSFDPEVSVVVPMYNKGNHLADTVRSVMSAAGDSAPRTELVIVDDHSTDDSHAVAARLLDEIDWFPATVVARAANGGPAVARNVGFDAARAPHVVALEAGSTLYPTGLRRLLDGLQSAPSDVVATYGIVARFDTTGSLGPAGHMSWDLDVLVEGEFAAPAAMFLRAAWAELGSYRLPSDGVEDGREEYDLWLSAAERGLRAEPVGSVIGRHREGLAAIVKISDVDTASSFVILRERHPRLPWPS